MYNLLIMVIKNKSIYGFILRYWYNVDILPSPNFFSFLFVGSFKNNRNSRQHVKHKDSTVKLNWIQSERRSWWGSSRGRGLWLTCDCSWPFTISPLSFLLSGLRVLGPFNFLAPTPLALAPEEGFSWLPSCFLGLAKGRGLSVSPLMCLS